MPDVNEPYYLGKAIHFWNPDWARGDFFLESADTHKVFYFTFGWLSLWLGPRGAGLGRTPAGVAAAGLGLAAAERRPSCRGPGTRCSPPPCFVCLTDRCHMAGEWVVGGVEAKDFAYVFVFLGLEAIVRNRWNRGLLLFGAAAAFHVVVGGWAVVAAGVAWLRLVARPPSALPDDSHSRGRLATNRRRCARFGRDSWAACCWPCRASCPRSRSIGASTRRPPGRPTKSMSSSGCPITWCSPACAAISSFVSPCSACCGCCWGSGRNGPAAGEQQGSTSRLRAFVIGAVVITLAGAAINLLIYVGCRGLAADLLRYYWFRLTDVAVPLGVALEGRPGDAPWPRKTPSRCNAAGIAASLRLRHLLSYRWLALLFLIAAYQIGDRSLDRLSPPQPRSHKVEGMEDFEDWRAACAWVADSGQIPPGACFLTPRMSHTFKWYTGHSEVATWKDIPQDAKDMVQWWSRLQELYATGCPPPRARWHGSLTELNTERLRHLGAKYGADYLITERSELAVKLPLLHRNEHYAIYRLR